MFGLLAILLAAIGAVMSMWALGTQVLWLLIAIFVGFFIFNDSCLYWTITIVAMSWAFIVVFGFGTWLMMWIGVAVLIWFHSLVQDL